MSADIILTSSDIPDVTAQEKEFQSFLAGEVVPQDEVIAPLGDHVTGETVQSVSYGYFRKVMLTIGGQGTPKHYLKVSLDDTSHEMLETEALGYESYKSGPDVPFQAPDFKLHSPEHHMRVAVLSDLSGSSLRPRSCLRIPAQPFTKSDRSVPLETYFGFSTSYGLTHSPLSSWITRQLELMASSYQVEHIPTSRSHGDFVYWNVLDFGGNELGILDFEYFAQDRVADFDEWYWIILPLVRKAARFPEVLSSPKFIIYVAVKVWRRSTGTDFDGRPKLHLTLMLLDHLIRMSREHEHERIISLIGMEAFELRARIMKLYIKLIEELIS